MKRFFWVLLIVVLAIVGCDRDEEQSSNTRMIRMEIERSGNVSFDDYSEMEHNTFGKPIWLDDDYLIYYKAKLYRASLNNSDYQQLLPDSIDCYGYGITYSLEQQKIWFCNEYGLWRCNFNGGDITKISDTPLIHIQLSNNENFITGFRIDRANSICLLDLNTQVMEEQSVDYYVQKIYYYEELQKLSYLCYVMDSKNSTQVRVRSRDGSMDQEAINFGNINVRKFLASSSGRYLVGTTAENGPSNYPLYIHDLQTGETIQLGIARTIEAMPTGDEIYVLQGSGKYYGIAKYNLVTGELTELHSGIVGAYHLYYLNELMMKADGSKIRIIGWGERENNDRRIL
jgi:hypothetical protein